MRRNKKGQSISSINPIVMAIIGAAFILAIGLIVMQQFQTSSLDIVPLTSNINTTQTIVVDTFIAIPGCVPDLTMTVSQVFNGTEVGDRGANVVLLPGNYTVVGNTINVSDNALGQIAGLGSTLNMSYSCKGYSAAYNATNTTITSLATIPTWIGIIIVVALAMLVLGYFYTRT